MTTLPAALLARYGLDRPVRLVQVKCSSTSPFRVTIAGGDTEVDALRVSGQAFAVNDMGLAFWAPPLAPICFKTA